MLNGINSYNSYNNYQSTLNHIRLQKALSENPNYRKKTELIKETDPVKDKYRSTSLDYLKEYSTTMSDVVGEANSLRTTNSAGVMNQLSVSSADTAVADVSARYTIRQEKEFTLEVDQLASAQQNVSNGVSGGAAAEQDLSFTVSGASGDFEINVAALREDGTAKTNREMLREAAAALNESDAGITAAVKEKDGKTVLSLESKNTGTNAAFTVSGQLGAAEGIQNTVREASNAQYRVTEKGGTERSYTSQSNEIRLDAGRMQADLKSTGKTVVTAGVNSDKIVSAVSELLDSYNEAVSFLDKNVSHGRGTDAQLAKLERPLAAESTLKRLGISEDKEGNLVLDKEQLKKSLKEQPELTKDLLSGSHGLAQTMYDRSVSAMSANSASLIMNDLKEIDQEAITDPLQYMNMYSRNGAYQMNNYMALGLMMNYLA